MFKSEFLPDKKYWFLFTKFGGLIFLGTGLIYIAGIVQNTKTHTESEMQAL